MEIAQEKIDLISEIIKGDRKYPNNEDLYDDFLNEACLRSATIAATIEDNATLSVYLKRVVSTAILTVLKNSGRLRRAKTGYVATKEISFEQPVASAPVINSTGQKTSSGTDYSDILINYSDIKLPETPETVAIQKDLISFVSKAIKNIDNDYPEENFLKIYSLRYDKGLTQREIAQELGISQSEVSKRLYDLMSKVKEAMD